jgi:hypothetical protein
VPLDRAQLAVPNVALPSTWNDQTVALVASQAAVSALNSAHADSSC